MNWIKSNQLQIAEIVTHEKWKELEPEVELELEAEAALETAVTVAVAAAQVEDSVQEW